MAPLAIVLYIHAVTNARIQGCGEAFVFGGRDNYLPDDLHVNNYNTHLNDYHLIRTHQLGYMSQDNLVYGHLLSIHRGFNEI